MRFHNGDHVRIAADLGPSMRHFEADCEAIVISSYAEQFGGNDHDSLTLHIKGRGKVSWYYASQLTLIAREHIFLLEQWEAEAKAEREQKADLDWIFANGEDVLASAHGATVQALANCLGISDLWGPRGEGFTYYANAMQVLTLAKPFLRRGDKDGWLAFCAAAKPS